jgi:Asp-tRNA(Asn)/Glu-tRNA(Gln) amidotransferase A subunit family amidase
MKTHIQSVEGELDRQDGLGLAQLVRTGQVSAAELLEAVIDRAERLNPELNFIATRIYEEARAVAAQPRFTGAFAGVPLPVKEMGAMIRGVPTTAGSRMMAGAVAPFDNEFVVRLRAQGFNLFCTTTAPEMGLNFVTESALHGVTRNPWNPKLTPGGSSGGSAAMVASGVAPIAHANDGGGSIRVPASCCGLFGMKATRARSPAGPMMEVFGGMISDNAVSRTVRDNAAFLDGIAGPEIGSPYWAPPMSGSYLSEVGKDPGRLRIALMRSYPGRPVDPECVAAVEDAAALCASLGHEVIEDQPAIDFDTMSRAHYLIAAATTGTMIDMVAGMRGQPVADDELEVLTRIFLNQTRRDSAVDHARAMMTIREVGRQFSEFMEGYDVILTPTVARRSIEIGEFYFTDPTATLEEIRAKLMGFATFTPLQNATGHPAASVPLYWTDDDLPIGVQIGGRFGGEDLLFRLAAQLEAARPWFGRRPAIHASRS